MPYEAFNNEKLACMTAAHGTAVQATCNWSDSFCTTCEGWAKCTVVQGRASCCAHSDPTCQNNCSVDRHQSILHGHIQELHCAHGSGVLHASRKDTSSSEGTGCRRGWQDLSGRHAGCCHPGLASPACQPVLPCLPPFSCHFCSAMCVLLCLFCHGCPVMFTLSCSPCHAYSVCLTASITQIKISTRQLPFDFTAHHCSFLSGNN